ncbi:MAG: NosD domain-containing protein [Methanoregulaceae archaeon]
MLINRVLFLLFFSCALMGAALAAEVAVCTAASDQYDPDTDGQYVVWEDHRASPWRVYVYTIDTGTSAPVPLRTGSLGQAQPAVSGGRVVYVSTTATGYEVCLYSIAGGSTTVVRSSAHLLERPDVYADLTGVTVAWGEYRQDDPYGAPNSDIWVYRKPAFGFTTTAQVSDGGYESDPSVSRDFIAWMHKAEVPGPDSYRGPCDIYARTVSAGTPVLVSTTTPGERNLFPDVSGSRVVWQAHPEIDGYGSRVLLDDLSTTGTGPKVLRDAVTSTQVSRQPAVSGERVVCIDTDFSADTNALKVREPETDTWFGLGPGTDASVPRISGTTVVWQDGRAGNQDIYLARTTPTPIAGCTVIDEPGYYTLTADLVNSACPWGIAVLCSDVLLDGQGHRIDGVARGGTKGIALDHGPIRNVNVRDLRVSEWGYGIHGGQCSNSTVTNVTVSGCGYGIYLDWECNGNLVESSTVTGNLWDGVTNLDYSSLTIRDGTIADNDGRGISGFMSGTTCRDSLIARNGGDGIYLDRATVEVHDCRILDNGGAGVRFTNAAGSTIAGSTIAGHALGISDHNGMEGGGRTCYDNHFYNTVNTDSDGANTWNVSERTGPNVIGGPSIGGNFWGQPDGLGFSQTHTDADGDGFCDEAFTVKPDEGADFPAAIDHLPLAAPDDTPITSCTVITVPGHYVIGADIVDSGCPVAIDIQSSDVLLDGQGHLVDGRDTAGSTGIRVTADPDVPRENVQVRNVRLTDWETGLAAFACDSCFVSFSQARSCDMGIALDEGSRNSTVIECTAEENLARGIAVLTDSAVEIRNCTVRKNIGSGIYAADSEADCTGSEVSGNQGDGISFLRSHGDLVDNTIQKNTGTGILGDRSAGGTITGNLVTGNAIGFRDTSPSGEGGKREIYNNHFNNTANAEGLAFNTWNVAERPGPNIVGGPSIGGNYWALPNGSGFSQTHPDGDGDGFCDAAYTINAGFAGSPNVDHLPLRAPVGPAAPGPFPGMLRAPLDLDHDGKYEDVNGNGRKDFADVTLYFTQLQWLTANEPLAAFDYNDNGRIDFADVVWLFNNL